MNKNSIGNLVAANMEEIINSESHIEMFKAPSQVKIASKKECCECTKCGDSCPCKKKCIKECKDCHSEDVNDAIAVQNLVTTLTRLSFMLDELGLEKSSTSTLTALDSMITELAVKKFANINSFNKIALEEILNLDDENDVSDRLAKELEKITEGHPDLNSYTNEFGRDEFGNELEDEYDSHSRFDTIPSRDTFLDIGNEYLINGDLELDPGDNSDKKLNMPPLPEFDYLETNPIFNRNKEEDLIQNEMQTIKPSKRHYDEGLNDTMARLNAWIKKQADKNESEEDEEEKDEESFEDEE